MAAHVAVQIAVELHLKLVPMTVEVHLLLDILGKGTIIEMTAQEVGMDIKVRITKGIIARGSSNASMIIRKSIMPINISPSVRRKLTIGMVTNRKYKQPMISL